MFAYAIGRRLLPVLAMPTDSLFTYGPKVPMPRGAKLGLAVLLALPAVLIAVSVALMPALRYANLGALVLLYPLLLLAEIGLADSLMAWRAHGRGRATRGTS